MAVTTAMVHSAFENLVREYRTAIDRHSKRGDAPEMMRCERRYESLLSELERKYCMNLEDITGMQSSVTGLGGLGGNAMSTINAAQGIGNVYGVHPMQGAATAQEQVPKSALAEEGVLLFRGAPMPDKWMGAFYALITRSVVGKQWKISFTSEFSSDTIMLWLSTDKYSGFDADKVAATYLETINQRRLG